MLILYIMLIWDLNLRHMRAAAVIGQLGSISAAAKAVAISQPAITQGLSKLELLLGQMLFERHPDGMVATGAGTLFLPRIEAALGLVASTRVTITQMRALIALSDAGSYAGASAATGLSQPSLHRAIGDLSIALKHALVERRGKGIALTAKGRQTARAFRLARAELDAGLSELAALLGFETGRIAIGAMPLSRARILPAAVAAFYRKYPDVKIEIIEGAFHELIEPLRDGDIDLMIGALRNPELDRDLAPQSLFEDRPIVIGRSGHPAIGGATDMESLAQYPWILPSRGTPLRTQWESLFKDAAVPLPPVPIDCGSVMTSRQIMMDSDFLTLLSPDQVAVELEAGWLAKIADVPNGLTRNIGVTTRKGWRPTAIQAAFLQTLKDTSAQA